MASMYEIAGRYQALLNSYDAAETDEERAEILSLIAETGDDMNDKSENYAKIIRNLKANISGYETEIDRLTAHKRADQNVIDRLMATLKDAMEQTGQKEVKTSIGKFRLQDNPWRCEVINVEDVPMEYRTPQPDKVDRAGIMRHFRETGEMLDGIDYKRDTGLRFR